MEFIQYLLSAVLAGVGLLIGVVQAKISPEELKAGKPYFVFLKKILFFIMLVLFSYYLIENKIILAVVVILSGLILYKYDFDYIFIYPLFGFMLYSFTHDNFLFSIFAVLIFFIGFPIGTLVFLTQNKRLHTANLIISLALFLAITLPLFFSNF